MPELAADVAMVFQDSDAQVVTGTLLDEVCFGPENLCLPVAEVLERAERALRSVELWERRDEDPAVLSGGGRQRLAIACALALGAPLLVLDEPTANLDPAGTEEVYAVLRTVLDEGRSVLLVEHDVDAALELVDRVVVLDREGRTVRTGPVREVLVGDAALLADLGVHRPTAVLVAEQLARAGTILQPAPLTIRELTAALDAVSVLPDPPVVPDVATSDEVVVDVRDLTLTRGESIVLHGVSLRVRRGEMVALVGVNGAGKTTLAQVVAGVLSAPSGTVDVAGTDPARVDAATLVQRVGFVFQNPEHQFVTDRVDAELALGMRLAGVDEDEVAVRVDEVLRRFGLDEHRATHPFLLSGGQKRRLSVGTVLVTRPDVVVLDEPTYGQDRERAVELLELLDAARADGATVIVVSHDMQLVADHATRVVVMDGGRVLADGPTAEVYADRDLLLRAGLRPSPLATATAGLVRHPAWRSVTRLSDLPAPAPAEALVTT